MNDAHQSARSRADLGSRFRMIKSVHIKDFRCFRDTKIDNCAPINIIVGENGAGKTSLMEGIFLALSNNPDKGALLRQHRGAEVQFVGNLSSVVEAIYGDFFPNGDLSLKPTISIKGDGEETRSVSILRGRGDVRIPLGAKTAAEAEVLSPIIFEWTTSKKKKIRAGVRVSAQGIKFESTSENIGGDWSLYAANAPVPSREPADRFTALKRNKRADLAFIKGFKQIFDWIEDISVESSAGSPILSATIKGGQTIIPLYSVSGGINRAAAILLAIASSDKGIVMVDEIENGIFHSKQLQFCAALLSFAREHQCQLFLSTHSDEWLKGLIQAAGKQVDDISLWRVERDGHAQPVVKQFSGKTLKAGIDHGTDVRG